jgi:hypothetical protein
MHRDKFTLFCQEVTTRQKKSKAIPEKGRESP